jgi:hypothetical protein
MAKTELFNTYKIPTYAICALEYGDYSDLEDKDIENIEKFKGTLNKACPLGYILDWDQETLNSPYFTSVPEFGLPMDVTDCKVYRIMPENWNIEKVWWHHFPYPVRHINVDGKAYTIATTKLYDRLLVALLSGDKGAATLDDSILYYCTLEEMYKLTDEELYKLTE